MVSTIGARPAKLARMDSLALANSARDQGDWAAASIHYRSYLATQPGAFPIWVQLGHALKESGKRIEALVAYDRALAIRPNDADLQLNLGHLHKLLGHRDEAIACYRRSLEIDGNIHARAEIERLSPNILSKAQLPASPLAASTTSAAQPSTIQFAIPRRKREATLGDAARDRGEWRLASEYYRRHLDKNPGHFAIWVQYGHSLKEQGNLAGAKDAYLTAIKLDAQDADVRLQLGHVLKVMGDRSAALVAYSQAFQLKPSLPGVYDELSYLGVGASELLRLAVKGPDSPLPALPSTDHGFTPPPNVPATSALPIGMPALAEPARPWLPGPLQDYWLPQRMRDYLLEQFDHETLTGVEYLMAIIVHATEKDSGFLQSEIGFDFKDRMRSLAPTAGGANDFDVSIVLPVYNNIIYTLTCIYSLFLFKSNFNFEIIVGDDRSSDDTFSVCSAISNIVRVVRHEKNLGFLGNCNAAARLARGRYVLFLNNDTITLPGWLDGLISSFTQHEGVGFAGSKLINADGTLQEAGGIFWNDGSAWNYGRNGDPRAPEFNYFKDTDYCSGASIALPRDLWERLRGFDPEFAPAYCEDSDLAFRVRQAGYRTVYQPRSALIHHEGKSHGSDVGSGIKAYQIVNSQKLFDRWKDVLSKDHFPNAENVYVARDRSRNKPHVLFIDHYVPQWDRDAGSKTIYNYITYFVRQGYQVILWPDNLNEDREYVERLQAIGVEVIYSAKYIGKFAEWISESGKWIRYVIASRPHVAEKYIGIIRKYSEAKILYYGHDLHWQRLLNEYEIMHTENILKESAKVKMLEDSVISAVDVAMYPSQTECDYIRRAFPTKRAYAIPAYIYSFDEIRVAKARIEARAMLSGPPSSDVLFVGGFAHRPNVDAAIWFISEIIPVIRRSRPDVRFLFAGSNPPDELFALQKPGIEVLGRVSDEALDQLHITSALTVAPLRYGAGVKGKVIDAFARGLPVVSTDVGLQGVENSESLAFIANDAGAFANAVVEALENQHAAVSKARSALRFIEARYTDEAMGAVFEEIIAD